MKITFEDKGIKAMIDGTEYEFFQEPAGLNVSSRTPIIILDNKTYYGQAIANKPSNETKSKAMNKDAYILQNNLPDCKAGAEFVYVETGDNYVCYDNMAVPSKWSIAYNAKYVENNPEWFLPKQPIKDYEILSFWCKCDSNYSILSKNEDGTFGNYNTEEKDLLSSPTHLIHSVKRLSGSNTFTVWEDAGSIGVEGGLKIDRISIINGICRLESCHKGYILLSDARKIVNPKPVIITEEGVKKFKGSTATYVDTNNWEIGTWTSIPDPLIQRGTIGEPDETDFSHYKWFDKQDNAEQYVRLNQPSLSVNEIIEEIRRHCGYQNNAQDPQYWALPGRASAIINPLIELAKQKTNQ